MKFHDDMKSIMTPLKEHKFKSIQIPQDDLRNTNSFCISSKLEGKVESHVSTKTLGVREEYLCIYQILCIYLLKGLFYSHYLPSCVNRKKKYSLP